MIAKTNLGTNFLGVFNYCLQEGKNAEILAGSEMVVLSDIPNELAMQFNAHVDSFQHSLSNRLQKVVDHTSLSFAPEDEVSNEQMAEIAKAFIKQKGYDDCDYVVIKHNDTDHQHVHLVLSRVDKNGKVVKDSFNYLDNSKITTALEQEFGLHPSNDLSQEVGFDFEVRDRNPKMMKAMQSIKSTIDGLVGSQLVRNEFELEKALKDQGIDVQLKQEDGQLQGLSFKVDGFAFSGSKIGWSASTIDHYLHGGAEKGESLKPFFEQVKKEIVPECKSLDDFVALMKIRNEVDVNVLVQSKTQKPYGVSFKMADGTKVKGSEVGVKIGELVEAIHKNNDGLTVDATNAKEIVQQIFKSSKDEHDFFTRLQEVGIKGEILKHSKTGKDYGVQFHLPNSDKPVKGSAVGVSFGKLRKHFPEVPKEERAIKEVMREAESVGQMAQELNQKYGIQMNAVTEATTGELSSFSFSLADGSTISDSDIGLNAQQIQTGAQQTQPQEQSPLDSKVQFELLVSNLIKEAESITDLQGVQTKLKDDYGIEMNLSYDQYSGQPDGINFVLPNGQKFRGSDMEATTQKILKEIYQSPTRDAIHLAMKTTDNFYDFSAMLEKENISFDFERHRHTKEIYGLKYKVGKMTFKGSDLKASYGVVNKALVSNATMNQLVKIIRGEQKEWSNTIRAMVMTQSLGKPHWAKMIPFFRKRGFEVEKSAKGDLKISNHAQSFKLSELMNALGEERFKQAVKEQKKEMIKYDKMFLNAFLRSQTTKDFNGELEETGIEQKQNKALGDTEFWKDEDKQMFNRGDFNISDKQMKTMFEHQLLRLQITNALYLNRRFEGFEKKMEVYGVKVKRTEKQLGSGKAVKGMNFILADGRQVSSRDLGISDFAFSKNLRCKSEKFGQVFNAFVKAVEATDNYIDMKNWLINHHNIKIGVDEKHGFSLFDVENNITVPLEDCGIGLKPLGFDSIELAVIESRSEEQEYPSAYPMEWSGGGGSSGGGDFWDDLMQTLATLTQGGGGGGAGHGGKQRDDDDDEDLFKKRKRRAMGFGMEM
ncbi:relaxase/mobilization nuclease domain-containing protein [Persicobacter psychrovividus]|uniref:MobA/VirD2-like nuclease domain-containing protein n=1 Tax=Persicobacter psychrovividus TaxID=387638 RepID=A0ABM7VM64_9BACT|nr:hypothetical protein PEPS_43810 [Persicobacter psychrovividus]